MRVSGQPGSTGDTGATGGTGATGAQVNKRRKRQAGCPGPSTRNYTARRVSLDRHIGRCRRSRHTN